MVETRRLSRSTKTTSSSNGQVEWNGTWHDLALRLPKHPEEEIREIADSIQAMGQENPCLMDRKGTGLDGIGRVAACALIGKEPEWKVYEGDPIIPIVGLNGSRRHLSTGQHALLTAIGLEADGKRITGKDGKRQWARNSVPQVSGNTSSNAWMKAIAQAGVVLDHDRDLAHMVLSGEVALDKAYDEADTARKEEQTLETMDADLLTLLKAKSITLEDAKKRLKDRRRIELLPKDLAERVEAGTLSLSEAESIDRDARKQSLLLLNEVLGSLSLLISMADHPVPPRVASELTAPENTALLAIFGVLKGKKYGVRSEVEYEDEDAG